MGHSLARASDETGVGKNDEKNADFRPNRYISETIGDMHMVITEDHRKSHTGFQLVPILMTLNDL